MQRTLTVISVTVYITVARGCRYDCNDVDSFHGNGFQFAHHSRR